MSFAPLGLHPLLQRGLAALGFDEPTPIQTDLIPPALRGSDCIGLAPTGTGKTLAYVLPLAHHLLSDPPPMRRIPKGRGRPVIKRVDPATRLRALVLCPTRELAQQVAKDAHAVAKGSLLRVGAVWGKAAIAPQRERIARGIDLIAATPGRLQELLDIDAVSLAYVRHVVVDEADRMLDLGFLPQIRRILERLPPDRQTLLLTATFPRPVEELAAGVLREPVRVESGEHTRPAAHVSQTVYRVPDAFKVALTLRLVLGDGRRGVLVFTRTRRRAGWVAQALRNHDVRVGLVHGDRTQMQREKALADFAGEEVDVLVATDVAARGLHVPAIRTVINYDLPLLAEEYVHRVGRAGHGGGFGESFTFLATGDVAETDRWRRIGRLASVAVEASATPDFTRWLRPEERARLEASSRREAREKRSAEERSARRETSRSKDRERRTQMESRRSESRARKVVRGGSRKGTATKERRGSGVRRVG